VAGKISYINIFNRDKATKEDFGSLSLAVVLKMFWQYSTKYFSQPPAKRAAWSNSSGSSITNY